MMNLLSVSLPVRSRWFCAPLCLALALAGCGKKAEFDGANAPYGPKTATTQVHSTLTVSLSSLYTGPDISQVTAVVGQKNIAGTNYDRLATTGVSDPSKGGEYWIKDNSDGTVDFAGFLVSSLAGGLIPAASVTLATPITVNLEPPIGAPQAVTASGTFRLTDTGATSSANVTGQYTLEQKDVTVATGMGRLSGCNRYTGQAMSNSDGVPAAFRGQTIGGELWYHPSFGVVAFNAPGLGVGTTMTDSSDCGSIDSSNYRTIRKVGVVDSSSSFSLDTYDCDGDQLAADKNTHAKMLLELRWADEAKAMTDEQPRPSVEFGTAIGYFPNSIAESPASIFHPEENGKGFKYWYSYVSQAAKNEPGDDSTSYHIRVGGVPGSSAVRVTARIYYKVLPDRVRATPDAGPVYGSRDSGSTTSNRADAGTPDAGTATTGGLDAGAKDMSVATDSRSDSTGPTTDGGTSCNLIVNGNAEAAIGSADGTPVSTPGWTSAGEATAAQYGLYGWPAVTDSGPAARGANLFSGGPSDATSSLTQTVNVSQFASLIDTSRVTYALSGWLGGYQGQEDGATLTVTFQNALGTALDTGVIGPVTATDRAGATGLLQRSSSGAVPAGTRTVLVVLSMLRASGTANDGYADELSLVFSGPGVAAGACNPGASADGGTSSQADSGPRDAGIAYFTVSTPPTGIAGPAGAKISALKTTTTFGLGGIFWKDGRLFSASNLGGPIVSVMPGETGTLWADDPSLAGGNPSWRHGVPLAGGNILLAIDFYGGPTGLHEITPTGIDTPWTLAQGHSGIGDIVALPTGGWVFSDFESYNIFKLSAKNAAETSLIPAGSASYSPAYLAHDALTDTLYFVNMNNSGSEPWFAGDGAIYKLTSGAPVLLASPTTGTRFNGLAVGLGGLFPAGLYAADTANSRVVRVESTGILTPVVTGVPTPGEIRIDPVSKGMALLSADQVLFFLP
jgi:hypothetical protein